jgi:predicted RNase H-related nuclease YkuK (DUF458 family)
MINKMNVTKRFKKFGGQYIPDIIEYLKEYITQEPNVTISLGCDSVQKKRKTIYAITIMLYNTDIKNGAHVVFFRENITKLRDNFERLHKEAQYVHEIGEFLQKELEGFYVRKDLTEIERKRYKFHVAKCNGEFSHVSCFDEDVVTKNINLTSADKVFEFKLIDLHLDFNPVEGSVDKKGQAKNRSNLSYKTYVPWLRAMGYRVFAKPVAYSATSAADLLLQD